MSKYSSSEFWKTETWNVERGRPARAAHGQQADIREGSQILAGNRPSMVLVPSAQSSMLSEESQEARHWMEPLEALLGVRSG